MNGETVGALNRITRRYYDRTALGFAATHEAPRPGWRQIAETLELTLARLSVVSVLDIGCGNGRFARFLRNHWSRPFSYVGLDSSPVLVGIAAAETADLDAASCECFDFVEQSLDERLRDRAFAVVAAFGVLHHIPSHERRRALLMQLCRRVAPGGALVCSVWRAQCPTQAGHGAIEANEYRGRTGERIEVTQLEEGDNLVARGDDPARYCHFVSDDEAVRLVAGLPLHRLDTFTADGCEGSLNRYLILTA
jgi:tRNA (uracil-5-)-methyltransferase TRM9